MRTPELDMSDRLFLGKLLAGKNSREETGRWKNTLARVLARPKAELHCHLAGSMRPETLKYLAGHVTGLDWSYCNGGFGCAVAGRIARGSIHEVKRCLEYRKEKGSLSDYMLAYALPKTVLATEASLRRVVREVCEDNYREGVRHVEIRFNPWMTTGGIRIRDYLKALAAGVERATEKLPSLEVSMILSTVKDHDAALVGRIVDDVLEANRDPMVGGLIKGIDSAGNEIGFPMKKHAPAFARARAAGLGVVCHAGEAFASLEEGIAMVEDAVDMLGARRIGHGLAAGLDPARLPVSADMRGRRYDRKRRERIAARQARLRKLLRERDVLVEVCPSSNVHTGNVRSLAEHPLGVFLADGVPVAICTDNRWISHTKLSWEIVRMAKRLDLDQPAIDRLIDAPFRYRIGDLAL